MSSEFWVFWGVLGVNLAKGVFKVVQYHAFTGVLAPHQAYPSAHIRTRTLGDKIALGDKIGIREGGMGQHRRQTTTPRASAGLMILVPNFQKKI